MTLEEATEEAHRLFENVEGFKGTGNGDNTICIFLESGKYTYFYPKALFGYDLEIQHIGEVKKLGEGKDTTGNSG